MKKEEFKTIQEEVDWWRSLSQKERESYMERKNRTNKKRKIESELNKRDDYLKSGSRTY